MSSEHERIARIRQILSRPGEAILLGIGDDCAALTASPFPQLWTVDAAVEGVHFSRTLMRDEEIGYRAMMAAASDIAAMGGTARAALCALALPTSLDDAALDALLRGLAAAADELQLPIIGGNLARSGELSITTSVLGECRGQLLRRSAARPGDGIFVTGSLGGAALGLAALQQGRRNDARFSAAIARFLRPKARLDIASDVAAVATAAIDISDGLAQDLAQLCTASSARGVLELSRVPQLDDFQQLASELRKDPAQLTLGGGEDYELLFTAPAAQVPTMLATQIGRMEAGPSELRVLSATGSELPTLPGFDHFR